MGNDDAKRLILARRVAVAGIAVACGGSTDDSTPTPCLEPVFGDAGDGG